MLATIKTERLILRPWKEEDLSSFAKLNADSRVMECFPKVKNYQESKEEYERIVKHFQEYGWGLWAVSVIDGPSFIGYIGLKNVDFEAPFTPAVEIGWRLDADFWGKGYATEGAKAALQYGFDVLKLSEIVSFTVENNRRSRHVMEKIGMHRNPKEDFDHPRLPIGHPLRRHVLYRLHQLDRTFATTS